MALLKRELRALSAKHVVIELAVSEAELRLDGWPYADARPTHAGVVLSLESKYGPLRYPCTRFDRWQDNVRAIALALEALRKVDRYGVTKRGEQYTGWKQLQAGAGEGDATRGRAIIAEHGSESAALKAVHPDHGGDQGDFRDVIAARSAP